MLRDSFWFYGYDAEAVESMEEALEALKEKTYDLMLFDCSTAGEPVEFAAAVRQMHPGMPIIGLHPSQEMELIEGMQCLINNPMDMKGLMDAACWALKDPRPHP